MAAVYAAIERLDRHRFIRPWWSEPRAERGGRANVTFYFKATENVPEDWEIFVHVDDTVKNAGRILKDHYPAEGRFRTNSWKAGDIIKDTFSLPVPALAGGLEVWTGFYQGNERLNLVSAGLGLAWVPDSVRQFQRSGVVYRQLAGKQGTSVPECETTLVWERMTPVLERFVGVVG